MRSDQCRAARALLGLGQKEACRGAGVNDRALARFESQGLRLSSRTLSKLRAFFVVNGIVFVDDAEGIGVKRKRTIEEWEAWDAERITRPAVSLTASQCRAARALLMWTKEDLADRAGVARGTVVDFERGSRPTKRSTIEKLQRALTSAGVEFSAPAGVNLSSRAMTYSHSR